MLLPSRSTRGVLRHRGGDQLLLTPTATAGGLAAIVFAAAVSLVTGAAGRPLPAGPDQATRGASQTPPRTTAIENVTVIPVIPAGLRRAQTVVVRDRRIAAIGPATTTAISAGALRVDGRDRYLIPGLVDSHVHLTASDDDNQALLRLFVANGVTTVVNLSGTERHLRLRTEVARGTRVGPRIFTSGPGIGTPHGQTSTLTADDMVHAVAAQKRAGYDLLKLHGDLTASAYRALLSAARRQGLTVIGHAPRNLGVDVMFAERQPGVAHVEEYLYAALFFRRPQRHPLPDADAAIERLASETARAGTSVITTLDVYRRIPEQVADLDRVLARPEVRCLPRSVGAAWRWWPPHNTYAQRFAKDTLPLFTANYDLLARLTRAFHRAGVPVVAGTDTPTPAVVPGFSLHDELLDLVRAGLTPSEALKTATVNATTIVGSGGTLAVGVRADAVLLEGNPLEDISATSRIAGVLLNGRWLSKRELEISCCPGDAACEP